MSSGEADAYTIKLNSSDITTYPSGDNWYWNTNPTWTTWSTNTYPIYYYQVTCPKCNNTLWAEQDKITTCQGKFGRKICGAKIKAVIEQVDYEIPVVKPK